MFRHIHRVVGVLALLFFAHAQYQGWNLFDETANARGNSAGSGRVYHK
jgi:hypothetical protein